MSNRLVRPGWPETKTRSPSRRPRWGEAQVIADAGRLAVFVGAEKADVQIEARKFKIVRVAAEEGRLLFGGENDAHVGVAFVAVKMIGAPLPQRHHVGAQARLVQRFLFDLRDDGAARGKGGRRPGLAGDRRVDPRGHVLNGLEHVEFQVQALHFLRLRAGVKAVAEIIFAAGA